MDVEQIRVGGGGGGEKDPFDIEGGEEIHALAREGEQAVRDLVSSAQDVVTHLNLVLSAPIDPEVVQELGTGLSQAPEQLGVISPPGGGAAAADSHGPTSTHTAAAVHLAALELGRQGYKTASVALRVVLHRLQECLEKEGRNNRPGEESTNAMQDDDELESLQKRAQQLENEARQKNQLLKVLIDDLRSLLQDVTMWQGIPLATDRCP
ncbi:hypothetical protein CBR_g39765 [Chara braunii]|uniref:Mediator of RNA polymerase II transcription subunit 30 n=1 Tax=Chara braunii TaxID=69332 RepID=A0A388LS76_CHABU|nr:hypothetical protein CBR_g39765 [Chara braunii]|eukprot:GBG85200.1 hypothetical protein CBR_g39765 [Chara braunii]